MTTDDLTTAPFPEYYDARDKGAEWHLFCRQCGKGYALKKDSYHPGNKLQLLNHAYSHESGRAKTVQRKAAR